MLRTVNPVEQWISRFPPPYFKQVLKTSDTVHSELMASMRMYSEVKDLGKDLLAKNGHADSNKSFFRLQAYLRQAITFYESALSLHHRASPLIYYYAFLNLAKAIVFIHDQKFTAAKITHGLSPGESDKSLKFHKIKANNNGFFPIFYKYVTGQSIPINAHFRLENLLSDF